MGDLDFEGRTAWITGASSGIGRAVALELARRGCRVALSARSEEALEQVAEACEGTRAAMFPLDVTDRSGHEAVVEAVAETFGGIDVAFFNAGVFGVLGERPFDADTFAWNMEVNYLGMVYGIEAVLPYLRESDEGYLVGMSSAAAYGPLPRGSAYGSSKVAVKYMLDSLDFEWREKGVDVDVSVVCPGPVKTAMTEGDDFPYDPPPSFLEPSAEWAGRYIVDRMEERKQEIAFPLTFRLGLKLIGYLPNPLNRWVRRLLSAMNVRN